MVSESIDWKCSINLKGTMGEGMKVPKGKVNTVFTKIQNNLEFKMTPCNSGPSNSRGQVVGGRQQGIQVA